jgi:hypothetical protein
MEMLLARRSSSQSISARFLCRLTLELYEGVHIATNYIGACIASMDGDRQAALDEVRTLIDRFPGVSLRVFFDPLMQDLREAPEFKRLKQQQLDHIAAQRHLAETASLLPPAERLFRTS